MNDDIDEFKLRRGDLVRATHPDIDRGPPPDLRHDLGLVIERVPPETADNTWAIPAYRVLWSGPGAGPEGRLTLEPDHRLAVVC